MHIYLHIYTHTRMQLHNNMRRRPRTLRDSLPCLFLHEFIYEHMLLLKSLCTAMPFRSRWRLFVQVLFMFMLLDARSHALPGLLRSVKRRRGALTVFNFAAKHATHTHHYCHISAQLFMLLLLCLLIAFYLLTYS